MRFISIIIIVLCLYLKQSSQQKSVIKSKKLNKYILNSLLANTMLENMIKKFYDVSFNINNLPNSFK